MVGRQFFGTGGDDQQHVMPFLRQFAPQAVPAFEQLDGQLVAPLTVVENDRRRSRFGAQRVQKMGQGLHAAILAELLGHVRIGRCPTHLLGEMGEGGNHTVPVNSELFQDRCLEARPRTGFPQEFLHDAVEQLEGMLSHLGRGRAAQHPHPLLHGAACHFGQQASLATAGFALQQDQGGLALFDPFDAGGRPLKFLDAGHQRRFRQAGPDIGTTDDHAGISFTPFPSRQDGLQIRQHAVGRLVTIAGILA